MPFSEDGYEIIENVISREEINSIKIELETIELKGGGIRNAEKKLNSVSALTNKKNILTLTSKYLNEKVYFVRCILFVKSLENNWLVTWHQDKTVSVSNKFEKPGWGPWSEKDGILHVQPPEEVLERMVTFRIHLDEATEENGCLRVIPKSQRNGILSQAEIQQYSQANSYVNCIAPVSSALVMRPHILHASSKAVSNEPRRVLHIEYSNYELPPGVQWA